MKLTSLLLVMCLFATACGSNKRLDGVMYDTYGLANQEEIKSSNVRYHLVVGNLVWSFLLVETIIAPVYFIG